MELINIHSINPNPNNPRIIKDDKFNKLVQSLKSFPEMAKVRPIVVNKDMIVLGGNMRLKAMKEAGWKEAPVHIVDWDEDKQREFIVKDNVGFGEWDWEMIANEWDAEQLNEWGLDLPDFDQKVLEAEDDDYEMPDEVQTDIVLGDLFEIGPHRLLCGDSTDSDAVARLMNGEKADITFTSPPYNVGKTPNGDDKKYLNDNDNKSISDYVLLLDDFTKTALLFSDFVFSNIQSLSGNKIALIEHLYNLRNFYADVMIWDKKTAEPAMARKVLNSRFEYIYIFSNEAKRSIGKRDFRGTIDNIFELNSRQGKDFAKIHKATFPIQLPEMFITNFTETSVLDCFCGTGTTMVAAHQLKRKCYGMELDPKYCQVIIGRMLKLDPTIEIKRNGQPYKTGN